MKTRHLRRLILLGLTVLSPGMLSIPAGAQVSVHVGVQLPPPLVFSAPPQVIVLPQTYVYVVPDISDEVFFVDGWWWRPWQGRWYRSQYYDRGWGYYSSVPTFYQSVPRDWRDRYGSRQWGGQTWNYERTPHQQVEQNWNTWKRDKYWETRQSWGVQGLKAQPQEQRQQPGAPQAQHQDQRPQAQQPEHHGQKPESRQSQPHGQKSQVQQSEGHGQNPHAQKQQSPQSNKGQASKGHEKADEGQGKAGTQHGGKAGK